MQRFDSALRLNSHFHALFVDGVFTVSFGAGRAVFHPMPPPSDADLARVADHVRRSLTRVAARRALELCHVLEIEGRGYRWRIPSSKA